MQSIPFPLQHPLLEKYCPCCNVVKPREAFSPNCGQDDGYYPLCKACVRVRHAAQVAELRKLKAEGSPLSLAPSQQQRRKRKAIRVAKTRIKRLLVSARHTNTPTLRNRLYREIRRSRLIVNGGSFTSDEWNNLVEAYGHRCLACGSPGPLTADHVIPVVLGGSNNIDNIQPLCLICNSSKGTRVIDYRPLYKASHIF